MVKAYETSCRQIEIDTPPAFEFAQQLAYMRLFPLDCLFQIEGDKLYRAMPREGNSLLLELSAPAKGQLVINIAQYSGLDFNEEAVAQYIKNWLDLSTDLRPFYAMAEQDAVLAPLAEQYRGLHIAGIPDLFEALAWAIIGQQINLTFAYNLKRRFVQTFGSSVENGRRQYWLFPSCSAVAALQPDDFIPLQFSRRKAEYLIGVARIMAHGELTRGKLLDLPSLDAIKQRLMQIKGIGEWTADYVALKCLLQPNAFPIGDAGLQNAVKARLQLPCKPTGEELKSLACQWDGWEAYATFYLWRSLFEK